MAHYQKAVLLVALLSVIDGHDVVENRRHLLIGRKS
jgi:hypothetical protein